MKTMQSYFKKAALMTALVILLSNVYGAGIQKTYTWKYPVSGQTKISMDNFDCDLKIHVTDKNETEFHLSVIATGVTSEDENRLLNLLDNFTFRHSDAEVIFKSTFWKDRQTVNGKTTLKTEGGKDIVLTEFSLSCELWIPHIDIFKLVSKYAKVDMDDFNGKLWLDLYNTDLYAGNVKDDIVLTAKYANIEFRNIDDLKADLYNTNFESENSGNVSVVSKYSKFIAVSTGNIDADCFNDKFSIERTGNIIFNSKYSDLNTKVSGTLVLNCYNGILAFDATRDIRIDSKYADFQFNQVDNCTITSSYNDKFRIGKINSLNIIQSKYSNYKVDNLSTSLVASDGDNDRFTVTSLGEKFRNVNISGRYLDISLGIKVSAGYKLKASIQYPSFHVNEASFSTKLKTSENSNLRYEGIKGIEKEGMPEVEVKGNNVSLSINEVK